MSHHHDRATPVIPTIHWNRILPPKKINGHLHFMLVQEHLDERGKLVETPIAELISTVEAVHEAMLITARALEQIEAPNVVSMRVV